MDGKSDLYRVERAHSSLKGKSRPLYGVKGSSRGAKINMQRLGPRKTIFIRREHR